MREAGTEGIVDAYEQSAAEGIAKDIVTVAAEYPYFAAVIGTIDSGRDIASFGRMRGIGSRAHGRILHLHSRDGLYDSPADLGNWGIAFPGVGTG